MDKNVLITAERVGKPETFALVEPLNPCRLQRSRAYYFGVDLIEIGKPGAFRVIRRFD